MGFFTEVTMSRLLLLVVTAIFGSAPVYAGSSNPFRVEATNAAIAPSEAGEVAVVIRVPADHHLYRDMMVVHPQVLRFQEASASAAPTVVAPGAQGHLSIGTPSFPPGFTKPDPADPSATREQYDMDVHVQIPVTAAARTGTYTLEFEVEYQGCKKSLCWMPQSERVESTITVREKAR